MKSASTSEITARLVVFGARAMRHIPAFTMSTIMHYKPSTPVRAEPP